MPILAARLRQFLQSSPLRDPTYRLFYLGSIGAALGYTMQATISSWLMATLTPSALMIALVQTASTLPTLLFGLIAGAMSDIVERRRVIFVTQVMMLSSITMLGVASLLGVIGPALLLTLTFLVGGATCWGWVRGSACSRQPSVPVQSSAPGPSRAS